MDQLTFVHRIEQTAAQPCSWPLGRTDYAVTDPSIMNREFTPEHFMAHSISQGSVVHLRG